MLFSKSFNFLSTIPSYLDMSPIGFDISDQAIRFIEFSKNKKELTPIIFGEKELPQGLIVSGEIIKKDELVSILSSLREKYSMKFVKVSLPEEKAYFFKTELPKVYGKEIRQGIEFKLEENIPLRADESLFEYDILNEGDEKNDHWDVGVSAVPKFVAESYSDMLNDSGLTPVAFEVESKAMARSVIKDGDGLSVMVINIKDGATVIAMVRDGATRFTSVVAIGGNLITEAMRKNFSTSFQEAKKIKEEKLFIESKESVAIFFSLIGIISELKDEISKFYAYWLEKNDSNGEHGGKISKIILCGKDSMIAGLKDYLSQNLETKVEIGNVWTNAFSTEDYLPEISFPESLNFATAIGLALPNIQR